MTSNQKTYKIIKRLNRILLIINKITFKKLREC